MTYAHLLGAICACVFFTADITAAYVVDTGQPDESINWLFNDEQYFGGEFSIDNNLIINSIEGYFSNNHATIGQDGVVTIGIHEDGGNIPGTVLYSVQINIGADAIPDWYGATGLNWALSAGTYWVSFIPDADIDGVMPGLASNPLDEYALGSILTPGWQDRGPDSWDHLQLGVRIDASNAGVVFTPLGHLLVGDTLSQATGVSADGSVVVGFSVSPVFGEEAFRWTKDGGMVGLGGTRAHGVSADGSVVVGSRDVSDEMTAFSEAFRWTSDGGMVGLGSLPGGGLPSNANGVSADGSVVVGWSNAGLEHEAFRWTSDGGMVSLSSLPGGGLPSNAYGVSADGSVVVGWSNAGLGNEAFRWTSDGGMVGLGDLPGGVRYSIAFGVSADGSVVVGSSNTDLGNEAFRWTSDGGMVGLGSDSAHGVSADGSVIVGGDYLEAFLWTNAGGMQSIEALLISNGIDLTGWRLTMATGVSADGNIIVGYGYNPGGFVEAWFADIGAAPAMQIAALFNNVVSLDISNRLSHSLQNSLQHAIAPLQDDDVSNDSSAAQWLEIFIRMVESQRDKEISDDDADLLVDTADKIIDALVD